MSQQQLSRPSEDAQAPEIFGQIEGRGFEMRSIEATTSAAGAQQFEEALQSGTAMERGKEPWLTSTPGNKMVEVFVRPGRTFAAGIVEGKPFQVPAEIFSANRATLATRAEMAAIMQARRRPEVHNVDKEVQQLRTHEISTAGAGRDLARLAAERGRWGAEDDPETVAGALKAQERRAAQEVQQRQVPPLPTVSQASQAPASAVDRIKTLRGLKDHLDQQDYQRRLDALLKEIGA